MLKWAGLDLKLKCGALPLYRALVTSLVQLVDVSKWVCVTVLNFLNVTFISLNRGWRLTQIRTGSDIQTWPTNKNYTMGSHALKRHIATWLFCKVHCERYFPGKYRYSPGWYRYEYNENTSMQQYYPVSHRLVHSMISMAIASILSIWRW